MKQFSLKEYLKNPNQKVVTRSGEKVRIICTDRKIKHFPIIALCTNTITGQEICRSYGINGNYNAYDQSVLDLMFAPQKNEYWINVYKNKDNNNIFLSSLYTSEQEARDNSFRKAGGWNYVTTKKIEWEE